MDCQGLTNADLVVLFPASPVNDDARGGCLTRSDYAHGSAGLGRSDIEFVDSLTCSSILRPSEGFSSDLERQCHLAFGKRFKVIQMGKMHRHGSCHS